MAFVNIENTPISIQLKIHEKVTVPKGETWNVNIFATHDSYNSRNTLVINDKLIPVPTAENDNSGHGGLSFKTILTEGDTVQCQHDRSSSDEVVIIGGFVVQKK